MNSNDAAIRIGISSCLLGRRVRFDGGHQKDRYITEIIGPHLQFVPVCPEIEVGMPVPREAVRLEGSPESLRMVGNKTGADWTDRMNRYARQRVRRDDLSELCGFIFKNRSPSCGLERVKLFLDKTLIEKKATGLFARAFVARFPYLPVEEEGRLADPGLRDNFIVRVFAYHRLQQLFQEQFRRREMIRFHTSHKYLLLAHSPTHYRQLGALVADIKTATVSEFKKRYRALFMEGLKQKASVKKNCNVLQHIVGLLRRHLTAEDRAELLTSIEDYRCELVPLIVPITLVAFFVRKYDVECVRDQVYLNPHPKELMLRNHV
jgi:uncharacterized protein YbgA (DUF1722 family)/uncharacterized protein YbbK (DUF523 family)